MISCISVRWVPRGMLKTKGDRSDGYRGKLISQSNMDEVRSYLSCAVPGLGWQCQKTSGKKQQNVFCQNNGVRIDWPVRSSDMSTIEHV